MGSRRRAWRHRRWRRSRPPSRGGGWSSSTSTRWIVAVLRGGALTSATRSVTRDSADDGLPDRLVDLAPHPRQPQLALRLGRQPLAGGQQLLDVEAVARIRRHPARRGVRMATGSPGPPGSPARRGSSRRSTPIPGPDAISLRADGLAVVHVAGNDRARGSPLAFVEHGPDSRVVPRPSRRPASLGCELGLGVADDLVAVLLGDGVHDHACRRRPSSRSRSRSPPARGSPCRGTGPRGASARAGRRRRRRCSRGRPGPSSRGRAGCSRAGRPTSRTPGRCGSGSESPDASA